MRTRTVLVLALTLSLPACSGAAPQRQTLTVLAASSLSTALPSLARAFEADHPGTRVVISFAASSTLAQQVRAGAPADVLATASSASMSQVVEAGDASGPRTFARNTGQIAVYPPSSTRVRALRDLARSDVKVALCQPQVPCGVLAARILGQTGVAVTPVTLGLDVRSTLASVISGEVDAALVYVTDVRAAGSKVVGIALPDAENASTAYDVATVRTTKQPALAADFTELLLSERGQRTLAEAGFRGP